MAKKKRSQHVVPSRGRWSVRTAGASKASKTFDKQADAIKMAKSKAKKSGSELYIHGRDGKIRERNSYGSDPRRRKG